MTLNATYFETLAERLLQVQLCLQPIRDEEQALKAQIREQLATEGPGSYQAGAVTVTAQATRRLDLDAIAAAYPASAHPELYTLTPDTKKVRANLPPTVIEQYMGVVGDLRIGLTS